MTRKALYFISAVFAALASIASLFAGLLSADGVQIVLAFVGIVAIAAAGGLIALGLRVNSES